MVDPYMDEWEPIHTRNHDERVHREALLQEWIKVCEGQYDFTYHYAMQRWLACVLPRLKRPRPRFADVLPSKARLPHALREVFGLVSQEVFIERDGTVYAVVKGKKTLRLYSPYIIQAA